MPTYEYECPHEHRSQVRRPVDERDQTRVCLRCGHLMRRRFHAAPVHYRAPGFYATRDDPGGQGWSRKQRRKDAKTVGRDRVARR